VNRPGADMTQSDGGGGASAFRAADVDINVDLQQQLRGLFPEFAAFSSALQQSREEGAGVQSLPSEGTQVGGAPNPTVQTADVTLILTLTPILILILIPTLILTTLVLILSLTPVFLDIQKCLINFISPPRPPLSTFLFVDSFISQILNPMCVCVCSFGSLPPSSVS
jgi:hypothetical protein